jgi:hypothetical protein
MLPPTIAAMGTDARLLVPKPELGTTDWLESGVLVSEDAIESKGLGLEGKGLGLEGKGLGLEGEEL